MASSRPLRSADPAAKPMLSNRRYWLRLAMLLMLLAFITAPLQQRFTPRIATHIADRQNSSLNKAMDSIYTYARPASVQIEVMSRQGQSGRTLLRGMGSGFFIAESGLVLSAYHIVEQAHDDIITAVTADKQRYDLKLVGFNAYHDLALLQADTKGQSVPYLTITPHVPRIGTEVISIGNSGGDFLEARQGTITRLGVEASRADFASNTIEFNAHLAPGDSGGPVLNAQGDVIGVVSYVSYIPDEVMSRAERIIPPPFRQFLLPEPYTSYAVPITTDSVLLASLMQGHKEDVPVIGVYGETYSPKLFDYRYGERSGALIDRVQPKSPAAKAGLQDCVLQTPNGHPSLQHGCLTYLPYGSNLSSLPEGYAVSDVDVIVAVNGEAVSSFEALIAKTRAYSIGETVVLMVQRGEEMVELQLTLGAKAQVFP